MSNGSRTCALTAARRSPSAAETEDVHAVELDPMQRVGFFRDVLGPLARSIPFGYWFIRFVDGVDLNDPMAAAKGRAVFELHAVSDTRNAA